MNKHSMLIEGGNVFKGIPSEGIRREDIKPTLKEFFREFRRIFPKASMHLEGVSTLGSVGKKDVSGDIDLALDEKSFTNIKDWGLDEKDVQAYYEKFKARARSATKAQLIKRAVIVLIAEKIEAESSLISVDTKQSSGGTLFCQFPQFAEGGEKNGKHVQIDINVGNPDWLTFTYYSDSYEGNVKGLHRTQLMLHLFSNKGYIFNHGTGVKNKETGEVVATTPEQAIQLLSKLYDAPFTRDILANYFKLQDFLKEHLDQRELNHVYDIYLKTLDSTRCDIPGDLENYWLDNQDRLGLTGKFLPPSSKLYPFREV